MLVILGLLVGGVLTGQSLIRAAELRSVTSQFNTYVTATQTFRDKYFGLPGDIANATSYWGAAAAGAACISTAGTGTQTCNGDANGLIVYSAASNEAFRYWQQLANAGLLEGTYDGITHGSTSYSTTKQNVPSARINAGLWSVAGWGATAPNASFYDGDYGNAYLLGAAIPNSDPGNPLIKPEEAYNIDMKIDDGKPALGKVVSLTTNNCTDSATSSNMAANYRLNSTAVACALIFRRLF